MRIEILREQSDALDLVCSKLQSLLLLFSEVYIDSTTLDDLPGLIAKNPGQFVTAFSLITDKIDEIQQISDQIGDEAYKP